MSRIGALETICFTKIHNIPHQHVNSLEAQLNFLEQKSARSRAAERNTVDIHDLGFKPKLESKAQLELNTNKDHFGFMTDLYMLMEHIHQQITGVDSLTSLCKVYELWIKTMVEAITMNFVEVLEPLL